MRPFCPLQPSRRAVALSILATLAACGSASTEPGGGPKELKELPRPRVPAEQRVIDAGNELSFALFRRLSAAQAGDNVLVSPVSASMALGMTMNGAAGATYDAMRQTLGFAALDQQQINDGDVGQGRRRAARKGCERRGPTTALTSRTAGRRQLLTQKASI